jgi:hypothetical protein
MCFGKTLRNLFDWFHGMIYGFQDPLQETEMGTEIYEEVPAGGKLSYNEHRGGDDDSTVISYNSDYSPQKRSDEEIIVTADNPLYQNPANSKEGQGPMYDKVGDLVLDAETPEKSKIEEQDDEYSQQILEKFEKNKKNMFATKKLKQSKPHHKINFEMNFEPSSGGPQPKADAWDIDDLEI